MRGGNLWPAIRWQFVVRFAVVREAWYRLRLGLPRRLPTTLPAITSTRVTQDGLLQKAFEAACRGESKLAPVIRAIPGMSGQRYRSFINTYVHGTLEARYLEVGSWAGSTATAALFGNAVDALCIDNWSEFGGPKEKFFTNIELALSERVRFDFIESDFRSVDFKKLEPFNIYLFDGPHEEIDQYDGVILAQPALAARHLLIVDDWNWWGVRNGTLRALLDLGSTIEAAIEVRTTLNDEHPEIAREQSDWHNGYLLAVIAKKVV